MTTSMQRTNAALVLIAAAMLSLVLGGVAFSAGAAPSADLAANIGISVAAATRAIDLIFSFWGMAAAVALTGGWTAGLLAIAKQLAVRYGRRYAAAW